MTSRPPPAVGHAPPIRRLAWRLLLSALAVLVAVEVLGAVGAWWAMDRQIVRLHRELLPEKLEIAADRLAPLPPEARARALPALERSLAVHLVLLPPDAPPLPAVRALPDGQRLHAVPVPAPPPPVVATALRLLLVLAAFAAAMAWLGRPLLRDLLALERAADALGGGDLSARAHVGDGPIARLGDRFDAMADRIADLLADQRALLQAVSHELRTPMARMRFQLEALRDGAGEPEPAEIAAIDGELDRLDALIGDLLAVLRLEQPPTEAAEPEATRAVIEACVARIRPMTPHRITVEVAGTLPIAARDLERIVENLLTNAVRHARAAIVVRVGDACLWVDDDGPGVPEADRERIFAAFATGDPSRARHLGGVGLGLTLVRRAAERWGARVAVGAAPIGGARFEVCWPATP